uniref:Uncharacterized protein n=1 Tax=Anopheles stephensi TaxID=30069 RepID=A0A182XVC2_ANOST
MNTQTGNNSVPPMDCFTTAPLLVFADVDCDRLTGPIIPSATTTTTATTDQLVSIDATPCTMAVDLLQPIVPPERRPQTFDDYLDLSVQEMLQKAVTGQPEDGTKGEVLDPQVAENASPTAADDIAVKLVLVCSKPNDCPILPAGRVRGH